LTRTDWYLVGLPVGRAEGRAEGVVEGEPEGLEVGGYQGRLVGLEAGWEDGCLCKERGRQILGRAGIGVWGNGLQRTNECDALW
jgi:hypothetical protein